MRRRRRAMAEINVVPYIDVMLVLLIIFMVTAPLTWAEATAVSVNGEPVDAAIVPGRFLVLHRLWRSDDHVQLAFPLRPVLHRQVLRSVQESRAPDGSAVHQQVLDLHYVGMTRGPLVYATELVDGFKTEETIRLPDGPQDDWLQVLPVADDGEGPGITLQLGYRPPLLFWPYYPTGSLRDQFSSPRHGHCPRQSLLVGAGFDQRWRRTARGTSPSPASRCSTSSPTSWSRAPIAPRSPSRSRPCSPRASRRSAGCPSPARRRTRSSRAARRSRRCCSSRDPEARAEALKRARAVAGVGQAPDREAAPPELFAAVLRVGVEDGGAALFDALLERLAKSDESVYRRGVLLALAHARSDELAKRAQVLVLDERVRASERLRLLFELSWVPEQRAALLAWLEAELPALLKWLPENTRGYLPAIAESQCDAGLAPKLRPLFEPHLKAMTGGPRTLENALEKLRICDAIKKHHAPGLAKVLAGR